VAKDTSYTALDNVTVTLYFNERSGGSYWPVTVRASGYALTTEGARLKVFTEERYGSPRTSPYTNKEIYALLPSQVQGVMRDLYQQAINVDIA
jgi:hypothetical protein